MPSENAPPETYLNTQLPREEALTFLEPVSDFHVFTMDFTTTPQVVFIRRDVVESEAQSFVFGYSTTAGGGSGDTALRSDDVVGGGRDLTVVMLKTERPTSGDFFVVPKGLVARLQNAFRSGRVTWPGAEHLAFSDAEPVRDRLKSGDRPPPTGVSFESIGPWAVAWWSTLYQGGDVDDVLLQAMPTLNWLRFGTET